MKTMNPMMIALTLLLALAVPLSAATSTTTLHIEGMTCAGCETAVKLVLQRTPGVTGQQVSYEQKQAFVTYDASKTTPAKIAAAVADALSYKVSVAGSTAVASKLKIAASSCDVPVVMPSSAKPVALDAYRTQQLRDEFNRTSDRVRVVALLSPTCGICQKGQRVMQSVFSKYPNDARLRGFVVWLPMLPSDSKEAAGAQAASFVDQRLVQQWDGERASGDLMAETQASEDAAVDEELLH